MRSPLKNAAGLYTYAKSASFHLVWQTLYDTTRKNLALLHWKSQRNINVQIYSITTIYEAFSPSGSVTWVIPLIVESLAALKPLTRTRTCLIPRPLSFWPIFRPRNNKKVRFGPCNSICLFIEVVCFKVQWSDISFEPLSSIHHNFCTANWSPKGCRYPFLPNDRHTHYNLSTAAHEY